MASLRERLRAIPTKIFPWIWRLAVLALPWQTRWFQEGPRIAGYPWEEGRISIYGSQIFMLLTVLVGLYLWYSEKILDQAKRVRFSNGGLIILSGTLLIFSFLTTTSLRATTEWWIEVLILVAFFLTLMKRTSFREVAFWSVLSLIPQALLGIFQAIDQRVIGTSLLGIAAQDPVTRGVAVIEASGVRWLRAYGGFPHPNIFGGWLVTGIVVSYLSLKQALIRQNEKIVYYLSLPVFSVALISTYSRSAWLSLGLFVVTSCLYLIFSKTETHKKRSVLALVIVVASCVSTVALRPQLFFARSLTETRLEQKSLSERAQGIQNGIHLLQERPLVGAGLGANTLVISRFGIGEGSQSSIPISPHFLPLLVLAELGVVGSLILLGVFLMGFLDQMRASGSMRVFYSPPMQVVIALIPPFFFDHYLWSYWSGKPLLLAVVLFSLKSGDRTHTGESRNT